ncbi:hypothetical protein BC835DRAFT_536931 [Cytidiella melzeri]|nr:hypothetical protein BC835DRAFT_536931 [Cytidiella melzeri]
MRKACKGHSRVVVAVKSRCVDFVAQRGDRKRVAIHVARLARRVLNASHHHHAVPCRPAIATSCPHRKYNAWRCTTGHSRRLRFTSVPYETTLTQRGRLDRDGPLHASGTGVHTRNLKDQNHTRIRSEVFHATTSMKGPIAVKRTELSPVEEYRQRAARHNLLLAPHGQATQLMQFDG